MNITIFNALTAAQRDLLQAAGLVDFLDLLLNLDFLIVRNNVITLNVTMYDLQSLNSDSYANFIQILGILSNKNL